MQHFDIHMASYYSVIHVVFLDYIVQSNQPSFVSPHLNYEKYSYRVYLHGKSGGNPPIFNGSSA